MKLRQKITYKIVMWLYNAGISVVRFIKSDDFTVKGMESIPKGGPYLLVANHTSNKDSILLTKVFGYSIIRWVATQEMLSFRDYYVSNRRSVSKNWSVTECLLWSCVMVPLGKFCKIIPVDRSCLSSELNMKSIHSIKGIFMKNGIVGMYPEATFCKKQQSVKGSFVRLAHVFKVTIIPCYVNDLGVVVGKPISLEEYSSEEIKVLAFDMANDIMQKIYDSGRDLQ